MTHTYSKNPLTRRNLPIVSPFDQTDTLVLSEHPVQIMDAQALSAPSKRSPIGLNVRQEVDYAKVLAYVQQQGGVRAMLFHCDAGTLPRLRDFQPHVDVLIWRPREYNGETLYKDYGPKVYIDFAVNALLTMGFSLKQVWIHLHNEPGWSQAVIDWEYEAATYALSKGAKVVLLSPAVGTPEQSAIPMARKLIELAGKHPDSVLIGLHEYFSIYGTRKDPWYLERWQFWEQYRIHEGLPGVRYVVTEFGSEDIADDHGWTSTLPRTGSRKHVGPVKANDAAWSATYRGPANVEPKPYPGLDAAYAQQITMAVDVGHYLDPRIVGLCLFTWGNRESRWVDYDVSDMSALHILLAKWWIDELEEPPVVIPPPVEVGFKPGKLKRESSLRTNKGLTADNPTIEVLPPGWAVEYRELEPDGSFVSNYYWIEIKTTLKNGTPKSGWIALTGPTPSVATQIEPTPEQVPEEPEPPTEPDPEPPAETPEQMMRRVIREVVREELHRALVIQVDIIAALPQTLRNSIENAANANVIELRKAVEQFKIGA